jgi:cell division protein FtsW (lipid II flippase)
VQNTIPGGIIVAKRMRYKQIDQLLTRVIIADTAVFILYLIFASMGLVALKVITAIIALIGSALCLAFLYKIGEFKKGRSRWLVMGFAAVAVCVLVSLILNYPAPAVTVVTT